MAQTKLKNAQLPDVIQNKTIDTSNDIDTTTAKLTISGGTNGQVLSTDGSGNLSWASAGGGALGAPTAIITKTADETVTSSTTLQDDDELLWTGFQNGKSYYIELHLLASRTNTSASLQIFSAFSGNSNGMYTSLRSNTAMSTADGSSILSLVSLSAGAGGFPYPVKAFVALKATSDFTGKLRWTASASSTTGVTIMTGSRMLIWEVA